MTSDKSPSRRVKRAIRNPRRIVPALVRAIRPASNIGTDWLRVGPHISFKESGFVAADTPSRLLARHNYETQYIRRQLRSLRVQRSLEIGCGYGRLTPVFADLSDSHVAIDINRHAVVRAENTYPALDFRVGSAADIPFGRSEFDLVITWTVLQHIPPPAIDQALAEIRRVVRKNGHILLCEETRNPGAPSHHAWHRSPTYYQDAFPEHTLTYNSHIVELDALEGLTSPGRIMLFSPIACQPD